MNKQTAHNVVEAMTTALAAVEDQFNVKIKIKGGTFNDTMFTAKIECAEIASDGTVQTATRSDFKDMAEFFGLDAADLDAEFRVMGQSYRITGMKPHNPKFPILAKRVSDDRGFKFPSEVVADALKKARAA